ncbi:MAG TPA: FtsW/RodA/SpoVE family cell cycle protein [Bacillales bacterium]|nr:FtsW/RodA/SpoVE family cell cycle protein [Bacillales bacterium]
MDKDNNSTLQQLDYTLLFIIFLFLCISLVSIYSAPIPGYLGNLVLKQFVWYVLGGIAIALIMLVDFDRFRHIAWYLYGFGALLLFIMFLGNPSIGILPSCDDGCFIVTNNGATSWFNIPKFGTLQPSEFMKIFLIVLLGHVTMKHHETHLEKTIQDDMILLGKIVGFSIIPIGLVAVQPDLGTAAILAAIMLSLLLISGIRWRILLTVALICILILGINIMLYVYFPEHALIKDYQMNRIYSWLYPYEDPSSGDAYQLLQSMNAIGSGQLYGVGFQDGGVYVPYSWTDFIFALIAMQFGFLGASLVISLYFLLIYRIIHAALETHDRFGSFLCAGVIGMFTFQIFQNIGMTIQVLPITGIPLPFISYGGSSLLTCMIAVGIVLNVHSRRRTYMFE